MSSQATLVGTQARTTIPLRPVKNAFHAGTTPVPRSQLASNNIYIPPRSQPSSAQKRTHDESREADEPPEPTRKKRRINAVEPPVSRQRMMTRSRSRSVEPTTAATRSVPGMGKGKGKQPALNPVTESEEDVADVEALLQREGPSRNASNRPSVSSDDQRAQHKLRSAAQRPRATRQPLVRTYSGDDERVRSGLSVQGPRVMRNSPVPSDADIPSDDEDISRDLSLRELSHGSAREPRGAKSHQPVTRRYLSSLAPNSRAGSRGTETSDAETFPVGGTRAKEEKRRQREIQMQMPYTPPPGTRAAEVVNGSMPVNSMRRRLRSRA